MSEDSSSLEILLETLATQANLPAMLKDNPTLPLGWVLLGTFSSVFSPPSVPTQGFLAKGPIDSNGTIAAVLALGMTWEKFLTYQTDPFEPKLQQPLPTAVAGNQPADAAIMPLYVTAYNQIRSAIWNTLGKFLDDLPLYICGMSLGGPMAQIAALDLRPGNKGPSAGQKAPDSQPPSYVFSTGNIGNSSFATYYQSTVTDRHILWAGNASLTVDFFPTLPADDLYAPLGKVTELSSSIPVNDVPWLERSDVFYLLALGGKPARYTPKKGSFPNPPAGFSQSKAYAFSKLVGAAYAQAQHPGSIISIEPYTLNAIINANDAPFAYIFTSVNDVVVALRGTTTWEELTALSANSTTVTVPFNPDDQAQVHRGAYSVYSAPVGSTDTTTFSAKLKSTLKPLLKGKDLYLTGHDLGGAIANIAAADFTMSNDKDMVVKAIYTFGANAFANIVFQGQFDSALAAKSYQIRRVNDKIPVSIAQLGVFRPVSNQVVLNGQLAVEESTYHSMDGYINLCNPYS